MEKQQKEGYCRGKAYYMGREGVGINVGLQNNAGKERRAEVNFVGLEFRKHTYIPVCVQKLDLIS